MDKFCIYVSVPPTANTSHVIKCIENKINFAKGGEQILVLFPNREVYLDAVAKVQFPDNVFAVIGSYDGDSYAYPVSLFLNRSDNDIFIRCGLYCDLEPDQYQKWVVLSDHLRNCANIHALTVPRLFLVNNYQSIMFGFGHDCQFSKAIHVRDVPKLSNGCADISNFIVASAIPEICAADSKWFRLLARQAPHILDTARVVDNYAELVLGSQYIVESLYD